MGPIRCPETSVIKLPIFVLYLPGRVNISLCFSLLFLSVFCMLYAIECNDCGAHQSKDRVPRTVQY
jgi:hypothetical protein